MEATTGAIAPAMGTDGPASPFFPPQDMPMTDHRTPWDVVADAIVDSISVEARFTPGYPDPALAVTFLTAERYPGRAHDLPLVPHAIVLSEAGTGRPWQTIVGEGGRELPDGRRISRDEIPFGILSGHHAVRLLVRMHDRPGSQHLEARSARIRERVAAASAAALANAGFTPGFAEALLLSADWACYPSDPAALFRDEEMSECLRRFARLHPLLADVLFDQACALAHEGEVDPAAILPGLTPARVARLDRLHAAGWHGHREAFRDTLLAFDLSINFARFVAKVPVDWFPSDARQVEGFLLVARIAASMGKLVDRLPSWLSSCKGDWASFTARCLRAHPEGEAGVRSFLFDPAESLAASVVLPVMLGGSGAPLDGRGHSHARSHVAFRLLYRDKSLPACLEASAWWHAHLAEIRAALPEDVRVDKAWKPLYPETRRDGLALVPLVTAGDLDEEGAKGPDRNGVPGLDHCVATYRPSAQVGGCHIASVRRVHGDGSYERLATVEFRQAPDGTVRHVQVQGPGRVEALAFLDAFLAGTPTPAYIRPRPPEDEGIRGVVGYDWTDPDLVRRAVGAYAHLLGADLGGDIDRLSKAIDRHFEAERSFGRDD